jgi:predicted pyridoxine 5'-phosphate oxidase superfamily flavin-nucleotide-binding protein
MAITDIKAILTKREFLHVATCDFKGRPNVAPKFLLKVEDNFIYLVDHVIGSTWNNLKLNPKVSLSIMDPETLTGYQINGSVEIIEAGSVYDKLLKEVEEKEISISIERVIAGVHSGKKHKNFEVAFPKRLAMFKVKVEEVVEITSSGKLERQQL